MTRVNLSLLDRPEHRPRRCRMVGPRSRTSKGAALAAWLSLAAPAVLGAGSPAVQGSIDPTDLVDGEGRFQLALAVRNGLEGPVDLSGWDVRIPADGAGPILNSGGADCDWDLRFGSSGRLVGTVHSLVNFPDAFYGNVLVAGGDFDSGAVGISNIATWDGEGWNLLEQSLDGTVYALAVYNDGHGPALYAGGSFALAGSPVQVNLARYRWDGAEWSWETVSPKSTDGPIYAMAVYDDGSGGDLYIGGDFDYVGTSGMNNITRWDGVSFSTVLNGFNGPVRALTEYDGDLIAGGEFGWAGGLKVRHVARWDGSAWNQLHAGTTGTVHALTTMNDIYSNEVLVAGGSFTAGSLSLGNGVANNVAMFDIHAISPVWEPLSGIHLDGTDGTVKALNALNGPGETEVLYIGGDFTDAGGMTANGIATWDGTSWDTVGAGLTGGSVNAIARTSEGLFAAGDFDESGGVETVSAAHWKPNAEVWRELGGLAPNGMVTAMIVDGSDIVVSGQFDRVGTLSVSRIARWNGSNWSAFGTLPSPATAFVHFDGSLVAGGEEFLMIRHPLLGWIEFQGGVDLTGGGPGQMEPKVRALAVHDGELIVGGTFNSLPNSPGTTVNGIARWSGTSSTGSWDGMGGGVTTGPTGLLPGTVHALETFAGDLLVGGLFENAPGASDVNNIARYDGDNESWSAMDTGFDGEVVALEVWGSSLVAAGGFENSGELTTPTPLEHIAVWTGGDPVEWDPLDGGLSGTVNKLIADGTTLYVAGDFDEGHRGVVAVHDGTDWLAVDSGCALSGGKATELVRFGTSLVAGGIFRSVGDHGELDSHNLGIWDLGATVAPPNPVTALTSAAGTAPSPPPSLLLESIRPNPTGSSTEIRLRSALDGPVRMFVSDAGGRTVRTLVDGSVDRGSHRILWDGRDDSGRVVPTGIYFLFVQSPGTQNQSHRLVILR